MGTDADPSLLKDCFELGVRPGRSVAKLDKAFVGSKYPDRAIERNVPFTQLPPRLFADDREWVDVLAGRWKIADHITLGEARAVVKMIEGLVQSDWCHRRKVISLQDNRPTAGALTKGRSTAPALNRLCRQKAALGLASQIQVLLPWVESAKMPADSLSRNICEDKAVPTQAVREKPQG